jgi:hypothetical protein
MTSCQVSEKPKIGPVTSHTMIRSPANEKPSVLPVTAVAHGRELFTGNGGRTLAVPGMGPILHACGS